MAQDTDQERPDDELEEETRWSTVLQRVHEASQGSSPWYQKVGVFLAWSAGIAVAVAIVTILILAIVDLFSPERLFNPMTISNWLFYAAALILISGLLAPSASDIESSAQDRRRRIRAEPSVTRKASVQPVPEEKESLIDRLDRRRERALRRRMERVYNPWLGRLSVSAVFCFGLAMLAWVLG